MIQEISAKASSLPDFIILNVPFFFFSLFLMFQVGFKLEGNL
jgi:hypothetical protein